jgi:outer membrane lipoprotein SlyB
LIEKGLPGFGGTVGSTVGGYIGESPIAAAGGAYLGKEIGAKLQAAKVAREETKALKKMEKQQKKAAELGTKLSDLGK